MELVAGPANADMPVILVGDFNSRADGTGTATYGALIGAGFTDAWTVIRPEQAGNTWGHDADLHNTSVNLTQRLDLVLFRGDIIGISADRIGEELSDRTPSGLWPSDHAGVVATLGLHVRSQLASDFAGLGREDGSEWEGRSLWSSRPSNLPSREKGARDDDLASIPVEEIARLHARNMEPRRGRPTSAAQPVIEEFPLLAGALGAGFQK